MMFPAGAKLPKIGLVGAGSMGRNHLRAIGASGFHLSGVVDPSVVHEKSCSLEALIENKPNLVVVSSPTHLHFQHAERVLMAGVSVLLEKPGTGKSGELESLIGSAQASGAQLFVGFVERFNPAYKAARDFISSGALGRLHEMRFTRCSPAESDPNRSRGELSTDLGSHDIDLFFWITNAIRGGNELVTLKFMSDSDPWNLFCSDVDLGIEANFLASKRYSHKKRQLEVVGELGSLMVDALELKLTFTPTNLTPVDSGSFELFHDLGKRIEVWSVGRSNPLLDQLINTTESVYFPRLGSTQVAKAPDLMKVLRLIGK